MPYVNSWIKGPDWLLTTNNTHNNTATHPHLVSPEEDKEIRTNIDIVSCKANVFESFISHCFVKFSKWKSLVRAILLLKRMIRNWQDKHKTAIRTEMDDIDLHKQTESYIVSEAQYE